MRTARAIKQAGHEPAGPSPESFAPHCGHVFTAGTSKTFSWPPPVTAQKVANGYTKVQRSSEDSLAEHSKEILEFLIHLFRTGYGLRNFGANQFTVTLTQTVHSHLDRAFAHIQRSREIRIGSLTLFAGKMRLSFLEKGAFLAGQTFFAQSGHGLVEKRGGPAPIEDFFRRQFVGRFQPIPIFGIHLVERKTGLAAAALLRMGLCPFARQKMLQRAEQERTELPFVPIGHVQIISRQQSR